jgi:hypothetical protein
MHPEPRKRAEVTNREVERLAKKYPKLRSEEWSFLDFEVLSRHLFVCRSYEYMRESPYAQRYILRWREKVIRAATQKDPVKTPIREDVVDSLNGVRIDRQYRIALDRLPKICEPNTFDFYFRSSLLDIDSIPYRGCLFALSPEWPAVPFRIIREAELDRRLELLSLFADLLRPLAAQPVSKETSHGRYSLSEALNSLLDPLETEIEAVPLYVWWRMESEDEVVRRLIKWMKLHRPCKAQLNVINRSLRASLAALGAYRILRETPRDPSIRPPIYKEPSDWSRAKAHAKRITLAINTAFRSIS